MIVRAEIMYSLIDLTVRGDSDGKLVAIEAGAGLPFDLKRVYYIWDTEKNALRGKHAHKKLEQLVICTSGSCDFTIDTGQERKTVHLNRPDQALYLNSPLWREFTNFSSDCVVMVLASQPYDTSDYIHDYKEFLDYSSA